MTVAQTVAAERAQDSVPPPAEVVAEEDWVRAVRQAPLRQAGQRDNAGVGDPEPPVRADLLGAIDLSTAPTPLPAETQAEPEQAEYSVDVMLSLLAAERQDGLSAWSGRLDGPGAKLAIVAGGALAIALVGVVGLAILGLLFG